MTVKELIEKLQTLDQDLHVFTAGYEGGFHYAEVGEPSTFCLDVHDEWYYGPHESLSYVHEDDESKYTQVEGIVL
jgi:hypothetical protein